MKSDPSTDDDFSDPGIDYPLLNRFMILIRTAPAYLEWLASFGESDRGPLEGEFTAYLIPPVESGRPDDATTFLEPFWRVIADLEFGSWVRDPADWPVLGSIEDFEQFFEWTITDLVHDLSNRSVGYREKRLYEYRFQRIDGPPAEPAPDSNSEAKAEFSTLYVIAPTLEDAVARISVQENTSPESDIGPVIDRDGNRLVMVDFVPIDAEPLVDPSLN